jgi:hypothetical protein
MIPIIGVMMGSYIFMRSVSFAFRTGDRKECLLVQVLAVCVALVAVIGILMLFSSGASAE